MLAHNITVWEIDLIVASKYYSGFAIESHDKCIICAGYSRSDTLLAQLDCDLFFGLIQINY